MKTILLSATLSMVTVLLGTKYFISRMIKKHYGQFIREDGPTQHLTKRGTPTMGGAVIIIGVLLSYALAHLITWTAPSVSALLVLGLVVGLGIIGFLDDWIKISHQRSLGLNPKRKLIGQTIVGIVFAVLALSFPDSRGITPGSQAISFLRDIPWLYLPLVVAIIWILFLVTAWSNAVNLTDGLDGLAPGTTSMVFLAYGILSIWQFNQMCGRTTANTKTCYEVRDPYDLAVVALSLAAGTFAFLWWNAKPAQIFLGDTGSLALGGGIAGLSIMSRTEFLLVIIGGLFVIETLSVALQIGYFKLTKGKRIFKMAPIHHHFELKGWQEVTVVIRFWIVCGIFTSLGLALFYAEWLVKQ